MTANCHLNEPQLKELKELLDVCDELRKIFGSMGQRHTLTIPEIVVVGNQSVGKSSLLELLSGFRLPSGPGIATRCPIVLQIRRGPRERYEVENKEVSLQSFANALYSAQNNLVSKECAQTDAEAQGVEVTTASVTTRIEGPKNRNITLVDLPGIQYSSKALTTKILDIIKEYTKNPSAIILLVIPCASDPTATEAIQCAREVDEHQQRTVCVLTKPDELRSDDEAKMRSLLDLLEGKHPTLSFPKGVFITKARGSAEDDRHIDEIRQIETKFFAMHPIFKPVLSKMNQAGFANLLDRMEQLSLNSMRASLPKLKENVKREMEVRESEVERIEELNLVEDDAQKRLILTGLFSNVVCRLLQNYESEFGRNFSDCLKNFEIKIVEITKRCSGNLEDDLNEYLRQRDPLRPSGVINQWSVDKYCSNFIDKLKAPAQELFEAIHDIANDSMMDSIEKEVEREAVRSAIVSVAELFMRQFKREAKVKLKESFEFEDIYYFSHLARFYGPTVQMMKALDDDFTFPGQIKKTVQPGNEPQNSDDQSPENEANEQQNEESQQNDAASTCGDENKQNTLKVYLEATKDNQNANARVVEETKTLVNEQETLHQKLETFFFYTGYRVAGNVGKLLLYHFRKKMPHDLKYRLDSSVMDLTESLNPDPALCKQLKDAREDIKQLLTAQEKITAAIQACKA